MALIDEVYENKKKLRLVEFTLFQLLQHNIHLGAAIKFSLLSSHWFIFGTRQVFTIINLSQTSLHFRYFLDVIRYAVKGRRHILFVNERRYSHSVVSDVALSVGEAYVMGRWVGGSITNFRRIWVMYHWTLKNADPAVLSRFKLSLKNFLQGFSFLKSLPSVVFFNSVKNSYWATGEAYAMRIPAGGVTDTDALPDSVLYPIPGNDDAFGSLFFLNKLIAKVVLISKMVRMLKAYNKFCDDFIDRTIRVFESRIRRLLKRRSERLRLEKLRRLGLRRLELRRLELRELRGFASKGAEENQTST